MASDSRRSPHSFTAAGPRSGVMSLRKSGRVKNANNVSREGVSDSSDDTSSIAGAMNNSGGPYAAAAVCAAWKAERTALASASCFPAFPETFARAALQIAQRAVAYHPAQQS